MNQSQVITSKTFWEAFVSAGVVRKDESIQHIVIDAKMNDVVRMYIERAGDTRLLDVVTTLEGIEVTSKPHQHQWISMRTVGDRDDPQQCSICGAARTVLL